MLGYYSSKERPRQTSSKALKLELEAVRPDPMTPLEEYRYDMELVCAITCHFPSNDTVLFPPLPLDPTFLSDLCGENDYLWS